MYKSKYNKRFNVDAFRRLNWFIIPLNLAGYFKQFPTLTGSQEENALTMRKLGVVF